MRLLVEGLPVLFPFEFIYPEQFHYMVHLKHALEGKGHCVLEMPTGTGKTMALLALITAYQRVNVEVGKLIYCTRTVQEMNKVVEELRTLQNYVDKHAKEEGEVPKQVLGLCLSSRRNLCVHPVVSRKESRAEVDSLCHAKTAEYREKKGSETADIEDLADTCTFFKNFEQDRARAPTGILSLEDLQNHGRSEKVCPYFLARRLVNVANVVVFNYQYLLDPKIATIVSRELDSASVVVFDEAHNIDNVCIEALSVSLTRRIVRTATRATRSLEHQVQRAQQHDQARLQAEYQQLVAGLGPQIAPSLSSVLGAAPVMSQDLIEEAMPGNIRRAKHFVRLLRTIVEFLKGRLEHTEVEQEPPVSFLASFKAQTHVTEMRSLRFCHDRLQSLLNTLRITDVARYSDLIRVSSFITLISTYNEGFTVLFEPCDARHPDIFDPVLRLCCLDASLAIGPVFQRFRNVIITSGTLSPLEMYPRILNFEPKVTESLAMTLSHSCICPLLVTKGSDQAPVTTKFDQRNDRNVLRNYGRLLVALCTVVPDGCVCFFPSYPFMSEVVTKWDRTGILRELRQHKLVFLEAKDMVETSLALAAYKKACDCGRGGLLLAVARGKVAEGIDLDAHYGRCVVMLGIPFQYTLSRVLLARLQYMREHFSIREGDFLTFDAMRQASQCVGRVIRSKADYGDLFSYSRSLMQDAGIMVFADVRYSRMDKRSKLPVWVRQSLDRAHFNLSTDGAVQAARTFLRERAQPRALEDDLGHTFLNAEHVAKLNQPTA